MSPVFTRHHFDSFHTHKLASYYMRNAILFSMKACNIIISVTKITNTPRRTNYAHFSKYSELCKFWTLLKRKRIKSDVINILQLQLLSAANNHFFSESDRNRKVTYIKTSNFFIYLQLCQVLTISLCQPLFNGNTVLNMFK